MFILAFASKASLVVSDFYFFTVIDIFTFIFFNNAIVKLLQTFSNRFVPFIPKMNIADQLAWINKGEDFSNQALTKP